MAKVVKRKRLPHGAKPDPRLIKDANGVSLTEETFCQAYVVNYNVSQASREAGITPGTGYQWMRKKDIQQRIAQIRSDAGRALDLTRERLMQRLMQIIQADPRKLFNKKGDFLKPSEWDDDTAAMVAGVKMNAMMGELDTVRQHDILKAIDIVNRMMGYNAPEVKKIDLMPVAYSKEELLEAAKMLEELI